MLGESNGYIRLWLDFLCEDRSKTACWVSIVRPIFLQSSPVLPWPKAIGGLRRFSTLIFVHPPEEQRKLAKRPLDGAKNTGWKPMLHCFPDCRAISQSHPGRYRRVSGVATRRRNLAMVSSLCSFATIVSRNRVRNSHVRQGPLLPYC